MEKIRSITIEHQYCDRLSNGLRTRGHVRTLISRNMEKKSRERGKAWISKLRDWRKSDLGCLKSVSPSFSSQKQMLFVTPLGFTRTVASPHDQCEIMIIRGIFECKKLPMKNEEKETKIYTYVI